MPEDISLWIKDLMHKFAEESIYLKAPFFALWYAGKLSREAIRGYLLQNYQVIDYFPRMFSAIHARCPDLQVRKDCSLHLASEDLGYLGKNLGDTPDHTELFRQIGDEFGISRDKWDQLEPEPETEAYVDRLHYLGHHAPWNIAIAVSIVSEEEFGQGARRIGEALRKHYGVSGRGAQNYDVHQVAEEMEASFTEPMLRKLIRDDEDKKVLLREVRKEQNVHWLYASGLYRAFVLKQPITLHGRQSN